MKVGDLVINKLNKEHSNAVAIIVEIMDDIFIEDVYCHKWHYPSIVRVVYSSGAIEVNPVAIYELISQFDS